MNNDITLYRQILRQFYESNADTAVKVSNAFKFGDNESIRQIAHSMRSMAGNIGALELQNAAADLENALKFDLEILSKRFVDALVIVNESLEKMDQPESDHSVEALKIETQEAHQLVLRLHKLLNEHDTEAVETMNSLQRQIDDSAQIRELAKLVTHYKFKEASNLLKKLSGIVPQPD